jgi:hypothetical protein
MRREVAKRNSARKNVKKDSSKDMGQKNNRPTLRWSIAKILKKMS